MRRIGLRRIQPLAYVNPARVESNFEAPAVRVEQSDCSVRAPKSRDRPLFKASGKFEAELSVFVGESSGHPIISPRRQS